MRRGIEASVILAALWGHSGCADDPPVFARLPDQGHDRGVLVIIDDRGALDVKPLELVDGRPNGVTRLALPEGHVLVYLGFFDEDLSRLHPYLDRDRLDEIEVFVAEDLRCPEGRFDPNQEKIEIALPPSEVYFEWDRDADVFQPISEGAFAALKAIHLRLALGREPCMTSALLRPFAENAIVVPDADEQTQLMHVRRLNEDLALASSRSALHLVRKGAPMTETPTASFTMADVPFIETGAFGGFDMLFDPSSGTYRVLLVATDAVGNAVRATSLIELRVIDGRLEYVGSRFRADAEQLTKVAFEPGGGFVAVGSNGLVVTSTPGGAVLSPVAGVANLRSLVVTGEPSVPHAFGASRGGVLIGDARVDMMAVDLATDVFVVDSTVFHVLHYWDHGTLLFVASTVRRGAFIIGEERDSQRLDIPLPVEAKACRAEADSCGRLTAPVRLAGGDIDSSGTGPYVVVPPDCSGLLLFDLVGRCGTVLGSEDRGFAAVSSEILFNVDVRDGMLTACGGGAIYETRFNPN